MLTKILINAQNDIFYNDIHNYFSNPRLQVEYIPYLVGAIVILGALLFLGAKVLYWGIKRQAYVPRGTIKTHPNILLLLNKCIDSRVKMDFQFDLDIAHHNFATSIPVDVNDETLVLECSKQSLPIFALEEGRILVFYFSVREEKVFYHYRFETKVIKLEHEKNDFVNLVVELPETIEPGQKRNFLRIPPPEQLILGISIWPVKRDNNKRIETEIANWDKPVLAYLHEDASQFTLNDISSNGVKMSFPKQYASIPDLQLSKARHFAMRLDLWDPTHQVPLHIWTICRIQKSIIDFETQDTKIGVQFIAWATPMADNPDVLKWFKLEEQEEITMLGDWIVQRHLEEYRDKHHIE